MRSTKAVEAQSAHPLHVEVEEATRPERRRTLRAWGGREHDRAEHKGSSVIGPMVCSRRGRSSRGRSPCRRRQSCKACPAAAVACIARSSQLAASSRSRHHSALPWPPLRLTRHSAAARSARSFIQRNRSVLSPSGASQSGLLPSNPHVSQLNTASLQGTEGLACLMNDAQQV